jgi:hypothetical protein
LAIGVAAKQRLAATVSVEGRSRGLEALAG